VGDIVDDIDQVLKAGEPFEQPSLCPHCNRDWHGLPITRQLQNMASSGILDPDYRYAADDSEVLCPGGHEPVMVRRPAPCDCDICTGRVAAYFGRIGIRRNAQCARPRA
jgi:hypothetical protein